MNKMLLRSITLTLITCIILWYSPTYSRNRSGGMSEEQAAGISTLNTMPNKLDSSNEVTISSYPKLKLVEVVKDKSEKKKDMINDKHTDSLLIAKKVKLGNDIPCYQQTGMASWYGKEFDGKITASGELCNTNEMVASHRSLPFGTFIKVINNLTGQSVIVRINDRGPFIRGRIINLSRSAAEKINLIEKGVIEVNITTLPDHN